MITVLQAAGAAEQLHDPGDLWRLGPTLGNKDHPSILENWVFLLSLIIQCLNCNLIKK
jgi:hypothetical protein